VTEFNDPPVKRRCSCNRRRPAAPKTEPTSTVFSEKKKGTVLSICPSATVFVVDRDRHRAALSPSRGQSAVEVEAG
jgi:hypothetical protein